MILGFVLVAAAFLWLIGATVRSSDRKRFFGLTLLALVVGLISGFTAAWQWYIPELRATLSGRMRWLENEPLGGGNGQLCRIEQTRERQRTRSEIIFGRIRLH